ncbi:MAG: MFS transporter [Chloroflexi bacterium]|nr:MFS transporter [Chloroflexota bacterium]
MRFLSSLRHRSFALLWAGQSVSGLGDVVYQIALVWWVIRETRSASAMGAIAVCAFAPMLLFLLVGGVAVDRFPRLALMLASDLLRGLVVGAVALLAARHQLTLAHLYVASAIFGFVSAFFRPAFSAVLPDLVPADALPSANSLTGLIEHLTGLAGPALGALVVAFGGIPLAFGLDAASFFLSAACLAALVRVPTLRQTGSAGGSVIRDVRDGLRMVAGSRWLWLTIAVAAVLNVTESGPRNVVFPFLIRQTFHGGVGALGALYSVFAAGSILASVWLGRSTRLRHRGLLVYGGWLLGGAVMPGLVLPVTVVGAGVLALVWGVTFEAVGLAWTNSLQEMVPRDLLGRVSSIDYLGSFALIPLGYGAAGIASDHLGPAMVFGIGGMATALLGGFGLAQPAIRALD